MLQQGGQDLRAWIEEELLKILETRMEKDEDRLRSLGQQIRQDVLTALSQRSLVPQSRKSMEAQGFQDVPFPSRSGSLIAFAEGDAYRGEIMPTVTSPTAKKFKSLSISVDDQANGIRSLSLSPTAQIQTAGSKMSQIQTAGSKMSLVADNHRWSQGSDRFWKIYKLSSREDLTKTSVRWSREVELASLSSSAEKFSNFWAWIKQLFAIPPTFEREYDREKALVRLVNTRRFGVFTGLVAFADAAYIGFYADFTVKNEIKRVTGEQHEEAPWIFLLVFNVLFLIDIGTRSMAYGVDFLIGKNCGWNLFDLSLVILPVWFYLQVLTSRNDARPLSYLPPFYFLRICRIARLIQTLGIFRLPVFSHLRMIVNAIVRSLYSFFWASFIGALWMYMIAVAFLLTFASKLQSADAAEEFGDFSELLMYLGNLPTAIKFLFMAIANGIDWENMHETIARLGIHSDIAFIAFIIFTLFVMVNIVSGIFIERAFKVVRDDRDFWVLEETSAKQKMQNRIAGLFYAMDKDLSDLSAEVSWKDFKGAFGDPHVEAYLGFLGLDAAHLYDIFSLVDANDSGTCRLVDLMEGIEELHGPAKKVEVLRLEKVLHKVAEALGNVLPISVTGNFEGEDNFELDSVSSLSEQASPTLNEQAKGYSKDLNLSLLESVAEDVNVEDKDCEMAI